MAYLFNGATHIIKRADAVVQTWPITMHARVRLTANNDGLTHVLVYLAESATHNGFRIQVESKTSVMKATCASRAGGAADDAVSTTSISDQNWHSVVGEITAANARQVWLDNGGNASNSTSLSPGTLTKTSIGARDSGGTLTGNVAHEIADVGVWSGTLTADERASLAAGVSPALIRPDILEIYLPLMAGGTDYLGGTFTVTNATAAYHPLVYMPARSTFVPKTASSTQALTPSLFTDSNTFFSPTVTAAVDLTPSLFTNSNSFFGPTVASSYDLTPALFSDTNSFFGPTVSPGAVDLTPGLFTNSNTFHSPTVSADGATQDLSPALFTNSNAFFVATVSASYELIPALATNTNSFLAPTVQATYELIASIFGNTNTFHGPTVAPGTVDLTPALFSGSNTFYGPAVSVGAQAIVVPLFTGTNAFYAATVEIPTSRKTGSRPTAGPSTLRRNLSRGSRPAAISGR